MTTTELQRLYDTLGTTRAVADHLGISTADISGYLRRNGVTVRKRGGNWRHTTRDGNKIEINRVRNQANGDCAYRSRPVTRAVCTNGVTCEGQPYLCCQHDEGRCPDCLAERQTPTVAGAASTWVDPSHGSRGRRVNGYGMRA